jgi:hypothetical protein
MQQKPALAANSCVYNQKEKMKKCSQLATQKISENKVILWKVFLFIFI